MTRNWGRGREPDLDPEIDAAAQRVMASVDDLRTARIRVENMDVSAILHTPTPVTEEFMAMLAASPHASAELHAYAERVRAGECLWSDVELARPVPSEVAELKVSPKFVWHWQPEPPAADPPPSRPRSDGSVVGPSDWPDDLDDYPTHKSWLV